ncbi:hypothetical protein ACFL5X_02965 [Candidatus Omnitrophota bacterium]
MNRNVFYLFILSGICFLFSGCLLFDIPMQLIQTVAGVVGTVVDIVSKLPMPPPGVF